MAGNKLTLTLLLFQSSFQLLFSASKTLLSRGLSTLTFLACDTCFHFQSLALTLPKQFSRQNQMDQQCRVLLRYTLCGRDFCPSSLVLLLSAPPSHLYFTCDYRLCCGKAPPTQRERGREEKVACM